MPRSLFLQIHTLTSFPAALLNRDDQGFAKRIPFGGELRTRISSQCLKRHWRSFDGDGSLGELGTTNGYELSVRSRLTFDQQVLAPLVAENVDAALARAATEAVMIAVLGESAKAKKAKEEAKEEGEGGKKKGAKKDESAAEVEGLRTGQITVLGRPEIEFFLQEARALAAEAGTPAKVADAAKKRFTKEWGKNLEGLKKAAGLDAALFGRMVTSDKLARSDAAIHVAHAFTVHKEHTETDYFSAIDDLLRSGDETELGSGHIGTTELTSGLYYGYVVVDVAQLVSNLAGCKPADWASADKTLASQVVGRLVELVTRVSPGAKLGSTAPYSYSSLALVEVGASQPRTLANAFLEPVTTKRGPSLVANAYRALADYVVDVDSVYGLSLRRAHAALGPKSELDALGPSRTLAEVSKFAADAVLGGA